MTDKPIQQGYLTKCHDAPALIDAGMSDFLDGSGVHTCSFECSVCHEPCDIYPNPAEHVPKPVSRPLPSLTVGTFRMLDDPVTPYEAERRARKATERDLDAANAVILALVEVLAEAREKLRETVDRRTP